MTNKFKLMSREERKKLILKKMKDKGIVCGSGIPGKIYNQTEVRDLIKITTSFPELRKSKTVKILKPKADI